MIVSRLISKNLKRLVPPTGGVNARSMDVDYLCVSHEQRRGTSAGQKREKARSTSIHEVTRGTVYVKGNYSGRAILIRSPGRFRCHVTVVVVRVSSRQIRFTGNATRFLHSAVPGIERRNCPTRSAS